MASLTRRTFLGIAATGFVGACAPQSLSFLSRGRDSFRIAFLTDLHLIHAPFIEGALENTRKQLTRSRPDLILGGGDWVNNGMQLSAESARPMMALAKDFFSSLPTKSIVTPGNHDHISIRKFSESDPLALFREHFGSESIRSKVDLGGYTLITLPSVSPREDQTGYVGEIRAEDLSWLKEQLALLDSLTPIILLVHVPLFSLTFQWREGATAGAPPSKVVSNSRDLFAAFEGKNLHLVLQGHLHVNEFLRWQKTTFITGGALCGEWWKGAHLGTEAGFGIVTLRRDRIDWDYQGIGV